MYVCDRETLRFLEVNAAALKQYGYSRDEFLGMKTTDIRPPEETWPRFLKSRAGRQIRLVTSTRLFGGTAGKNGEIFEVEVTELAGDRVREAAGIPGHRAGRHEQRRIAEQQVAEARRLPASPCWKTCHCWQPWFLDGEPLHPKCAILRLSDCSGTRRPTSWAPRPRYVVNPIRIEAARSRADFQSAARHGPGEIVQVKHGGSGKTGRCFWTCAYWLFPCYSTGKESAAL